MKKKTLAMLLCLALCLSLAACTGSGSTGGNDSGDAGGDVPSSSGSGTVSEPVTLVCGDGFALTHNAAVMLDEFAKRVSEETNGMVTIDVHHASVLGTTSELAAAVMAGNIDFTCTALSTFDSYFPQGTYMSAFFLFDDYDHMVQYMETDHYQSMVEELEATVGIDVMGAFYNGVRHFYSSKPITSFDDISGMKLRVAEEPMPMAFISAIGATPTPIAISEVYTSISNGTVEGMENSISTFVTQNFYEVCPYMTLTAHQINTFSIVMSEKSRDKLTDEQYETVVRIAGEVSDEYSVYGQELEQQDYAVCEENVEIYEIDLTEFREACQKIYDDYDDIWGDGTWEYIRSLVE